MGREPEPQLPGGPAAALTQQQQQETTRPGGRDGGSTVPATHSDGKACYPGKGAVSGAGSALRCRGNRARSCRTAWDARRQRAAGCGGVTGLSPGRGPSGVRLYGKGPGFSSGWVRGHTPRALESRALPRPGRGTSRLEPECPTLPARELDGYGPPRRGLGLTGSASEGGARRRLGSTWRSWVRRCVLFPWRQAAGVCLRRDWRGLRDAETRIDHSQLF